MKRVFCSAVVAVLVLTGSGLAQYSPPANLKKSVDENLKKIDDFITKIGDAIPGNKSAFDKEIEKYEDAKKRWKDVEGKADEKAKKSITGFFAVINIYSFSIPAQNNDLPKKLDGLKTFRAAVVDNASKAASNQDYIKIAVLESAECRKVAVDLRQKSLAVGSLILDMRSNVANSLKIIQALEAESCVPDIETDSPSAPASEFFDQADLNIVEIGLVGAGYASAPDDLQKASDAVMSAWYWTLFEDPEALSEEEQKEISACMDDLYFVQTYVSSIVNNFAMEEMMREAMLSWADSQEDPWSRLDYLEWLACDFEAERYASLGDIIAFGLARSDRAIEILGY